MRKTITLAIIAAMSGVTSVGFAEKEKPAPEAHPAEHGGRPKNAEEALKQFYGPTAQVKITGETDVNGVKVAEATVTRDGAEANAEATADGYLIVTGLPQPVGALTPAAQATVGFFKTPPRSVTQEEVSDYWISVTGAGGKLYIVEIDAAGRIRDLATPEQMREATLSSSQKVSAADEKQMGELAAKRFSEGKVDAVVSAVHDPGYFQVGFKNQYGQGWAIMNPQGDVTEWRMPIGKEKLPAPVQQTIERDLHGDKITRIARGGVRFYRVVETVGTEDLAMLIRPDGNLAFLSGRAVHPLHKK